MEKFSKFCHGLKEKAISDYAKSRDIPLNEYFRSPFNPMTLQDRKEDEHTKKLIWDKHVKRIILLSIPCTIVGVPLAIALILFLAPILLGALFFIGIPVFVIGLIIAGVICILLNW